MVLQKSKQLVNLQTLPTYCSTQCSLFYPKNIVFTERVMTMRKKEAPETEVSQNLPLFLRRLGADALLNA